jgi:transcriptional regulator NrdR family protein
MKCPVCGAWSTVKESRESKQFGFRRRRECANEHKFTTQEVVIPDEVIEEQRRENLAAYNEKRMVAVRSRRRTTAGQAAQTTINHNL